jgi:PAS domain S-box-containing protein
VIVVVSAEQNATRQQTEQRWRTAFENSAIGIVMADFTGRYFAANSVFLNMLGYTESELYQLTFVDVTYEDDREANLELVRELVEGTRRHFEIEKRYRRKDGTLVWGRNNVALVPALGATEPCWFGIVEDITEHKRVEGELRAFLENSPSPIFLKDRHGRYLYVNKEFKRALRVSEEQIKGKRDDEIFSAEQAAGFQTNDRRVLEAGVPMEFEELAVQEDGQHTSIVHKFPLFNAEGEVYALGGIATDITERKRAQKELLILKDVLARVSRLTTMGELAASIAHEINQPLTAVTNNSNACLRLLADRNLEPEVLRRALEEIVADGARASAVITRIRAFMKKAPVEKGELDINEVIHEVLALVTHELHENGIVLERRLTKGLPLVMGDRVQLQQVLLNLMMNGIEAVAAIKTRPRLLSVQTRVDKSGNVLVAIRDSGTGLGLETDRVFTPFFTTKANGMGMGLAISRSLVEGHGGQLWAARDCSQGAVFYFTLPAAAGVPHD